MKKKTSEKMDSTIYVGADFPLEKMRDFFENLFEKLNAPLPIDKKVVLGNIRKHLPAWYASIFIADLAYDKVWETLGHSKDGTCCCSDMDKRMMVIANEALQWHEDAILSNVVLSLRQEDENKIKHCTALASDRNTVEEKLKNFLAGLETYIRNHGTSVKLDGHLYYHAVKKEMIKGEAKPCDKIMSVTVSECSTTPFNITGKGDQKAFEKILLEVFGNNDYEVIHLSEGGDTHYFDREKNLGAVAHIYIVLQGKNVQVGQDYIDAMQELLSRLAMTYALVEMQKTKDQLQEQATRERKRNEDLKMRIRDLDTAIKGVEDKALAVRNMLGLDIGEHLIRWRNNCLSQLFKSPSVTICFCNCTAITSIHTPISTDFDTWFNHVSAGLLYFVIAVNCPALEKISHNDYWKKLSDENTEYTQSWGIIRRLGIKNDLKDAYNTYEQWKNGILPIEGNSVTPVLIKWAIGAELYQNDNALIVWADRYLLPDGIEAETILNGLNCLIEVLFDETKQNKILPTKLLSEFNQEFFAIRLSPVMQDNNNVELINQQGYKNLLATIESLPDFPSAFQNTTSRALLLSLGIDEKTWKSRTRSQIEMSKLMLNECTETYWDNGLWVKYSITRAA